MIKYCLYLKGSFNLHKHLILFWINKFSNRKKKKNIFRIFCQKKFNIRKVKDCSIRQCLIRSSRIENVAWEFQMKNLPEKKKISYAHLFSSCNVSLVASPLPSHVATHHSKLSPSLWFFRRKPKICKTVDEQHDLWGSNVVAKVTPWTQLASCLESEKNAQAKHFQRSRDHKIL